MIELRTTTLQEPDKQPVPLYHALLTAHGLPVAASIRLRTIMDRIDDGMKPFAEQRDAILTKFGVKFDEQGNRLALDDAAELAGEIEGDRIELADRELEELLAVEYEGLPAIPASMLEAAHDRAAVLLVDYGLLGWLGPLVVDDLDHAGSKKGK
jgi:hypothetical protein